MQTKLTEALLRRLRDDPPLKDTSYFDTELRRFALRVKPARPAARGKPARAAAWFFIRYTSADGVERRMRISPADTMTVDAARREARAKLTLVDQGRDIAVEQNERRDAMTMRELAATYLAAREFTQKTEKVQANDRARIEQHILHHLGATKASAVTASVARRLVTQVTDDERVNKRKRKLGGSGAARKALQLLAAMLAWAKAESDVTGLKAVPFSIREIKLNGDGQRDAVITSPEEYARLFEVIDQQAADGKLRPEVRAFLMLVASTGLRRSEAQGLRWFEVNLDRRQITLGSSKGAKLARKAGKAAGADRIGLPPVAAEALASIKPHDVDEGALVFVPAKGKQISVNRDWIAVRKAAGLPDDLTLHGLRHSVGTVGAIAGMSMPELQALLRHRQPGTTARYLHLARASGGLADKAMGGVLPPAASPAADVTLLRRTRNK